MNNYGVTEAQISRWRKAKQELKDAEASISETALAHFHLKSGDLVVDSYSGLHYRLTDVYCYPEGSGVRFSLQGRRVYRSGRKVGREAHSTSFLSFANIEKAATDA